MLFSLCLQLSGNIRVDDVLSLVLKKKKKKLTKPIGSFVYPTYPVVLQVVTLEGDGEWYPDGEVCEYPQRPVGEGPLHSEASAVGNLVDG